MKTTSIPEIEVYLSSLEKNGYSIHTIRGYSGSLERLVSAFSIQSVSDLEKITKIQFLSFVNAMSLSPNSKRTFLRNVRAFASWLKDTSGTDITDVFDVRFGRSRFPEVKKKAKVVLNEEEISKVIGASRNKQERLMMEILFHTFIRNSELANIRLTDIDGCTIKIVGKGGKESKTRLTADICSLLEEYLRTERDSDSPFLFYGTRGKGKSHLVNGDWKPITGVAVNNRVRALAKASGIDPNKAEKFTTHRCRGTGITISNRTRGVRVTQLLARHADISTTMLYDENVIENVIGQLEERTW